MAVFNHSDATLGTILADLEQIVARLRAIRQRMTDNDVEWLGFDNEKGQVLGRTALHGFCASGEERLRKLMADRYIVERAVDGPEKRPAKSKKT